MYYTDIFNSIYVLLLGKQVIIHIVSVCRTAIKIKSRLVQLFAFKQLLKCDSGERTVHPKLV